MLSAPATFNEPLQPPKQSSSLPRRTDSLSTSVVKPKPISPLVQSAEDLNYAKEILSTPITTEEDEGMDEEEREHRREERERQLIDVLGRMTGWVEELTNLLQQAYKNQTELETALTLTRSNLQLSLANNEMLEEALQRGGKDVGWRRWSEREGIRRTGSVKEYRQHDRNTITETTPQPSSQPSSAGGASRFFNFKSPLQRVSSANSSPISPSTSPTGSKAGSTPASASTPSLLPSINIPSSSSGSTTPVNGAVETPMSTASVYSITSSYRPPSPPSPSEREKELTEQLEKERTALQQVTKEKSQLEDELESLSQALFEEANKMVSKANQKLAETEEELRVATEQKEALKGALRIVEGENGELRERNSPNPDLYPPSTHSSSRERGRQRHRDQSRDAAATDSLERDPTPQPNERSHDPTLQTTLSRGHDVLPSPPPPPLSSSQPQQQLLQPELPGAHPAVMVTKSAPLHSPSTKMFWSPLTPYEGGSNRWSMLPQSPGARQAVRSEFEGAMRRMQEMIGEMEAGGGDDNNDDDNDVPAALHTSAPPREHEREDGLSSRQNGEPVSPRLQSALPRSEHED